MSKETGEPVMVNRSPQEVDPQGGGNLFGTGEAHSLRIG